MKKFYLLALALALFHPAIAQTSANDKEVQKQITDLKMSRKVIYADSYEGKLIYDKAKLRQRNQKKLEYMIRQFLVQDLGLSQKDAQELYDFVDDKLQNVERDVNGATVAHMFSYITKESLVSLVKKSNHDFSGLSDYMANPDQYEIDPALQKSLDGLQFSADFGGDESAVAQNAAPAPVPAAPVAAPVPAAPVAEPTPAAPVAEPTPAAPVETPVPVPSAPVAAPVPVPTAPVASPAPAPAAPAASAIAKPVMVEELINCGTFEKVTSYLVKQKKDGLAEWGNARVMAPKAAHCYVVICDKQSHAVVTVLGKGSGSDRLNYVTGQKSSDADFESYSRIYVQQL